MKKILSHLAKWTCMRAYWVFPGLYLVLSLLLMAIGKTGFNGYGLLCSLVLGVICHYATKSWFNREFDDDEIDFSPLVEKDESERSFKQLWKDMPWWERLLWIPILGFLGITWWVMVKGLGVLFVSGITPFVYAFSTIVVLTLLWLIVMITRKKNVVGYVLFYIVFDAMSAFSFNFVEFYDNVSSTQHMDRDMKDCRRFSDIQGECISQVKDRVEELHSKYRTQVNSLKSSKATAEQDAVNYRTSAGKQFFRDEQIRLNRQARDKEAQARRLQTSIEQAQENADYAAAMKARVDSMQVYKSKLDSLTALYRNDKQHFTVKDWQISKDLAQEIGAVLENLSTDSRLTGKVQLDSTEVVNIMRHLKSDDQDRFASLNKLFKALAALFSHDQQLAQESAKVQQPSAHEAIADSVAVDADPVTSLTSKTSSISDDQKFENRLLYMSIMLSILIDLLPLALGVFAAYSRHRRSSND